MSMNVKALIHVCMAIVPILLVIIRVAVILAGREKIVMKVNRNFFRLSQSLSHLSLPR